MANTIKRTFSGISSPNDLGYVDLPREAVLNNTMSPAGQRAFASIAFIPFIIPAAFFAPEATLLAAVLAGCGSRGSSEDPILTSGGFDGQGEVLPDVGTTDEGDTGIAADDGMTDSGDGLVAADDDGMSLPDDGMTLADEVAPQDSENDQDASPADDGIGQPDDGMTLADEVVLQDGENDQDDALIAADDDGMSTPDDGITVADISVMETQDDVALDQDATPDIPDATLIADGGETTIEDDGVPTADVIAPVDLAPDGTADQSDATKDTDTAPDIAPPCIPSCVPVANTITCEDGSTNVAVSYFVKCATQFACDGIDTAKASVNLSDPNTETTQMVTVAQCVDNVIFGACQAINANNSLSEFCGDVTIKQKPKPGNPPTVDQLISPADKSLGILPSGDQCFTPANSIAFSFTASDKDKDPLTCGLKLYQNDVLVPAATVSATFSDLTKPLMLQLPTNLLKPRTDYCWNVSCDDGKGGAAMAGAKACFTTSDKGLIGLWSFNEMSGTVAVDKSGNGVDGTIFSKDASKMWSLDPVTGAKMLCLNGSSEYIQVIPPNSWKTLENLSLKASFSKAVDNNPSTHLGYWSNEGGNGLILRLNEKEQTIDFGLCDQTIACWGTWWWWVESAVSLTPNKLHSLTGIINMGSAKLFFDEQYVGKTSAAKPTIATMGDLILFGKYNQFSQDDPLSFFKGCFDEMALYNIDTSATCQ